MKCYLGIDTSNYTTSAALVSADGTVLKNVKAPLEVKDGERGLRQSDAVFAHIKNLPLVMEELGNTVEADIAGIGYSAYPRDASGSYMPCFLAGEAVAKSVAAICGVPCRGFSHQAGHIAAAYYTCGMAVEPFPAEGFLAFHISGGTTELLNVTRGFQISKIGGTTDLNAGQVIDRVGVKLGLKFPCGAELQKLALSYDEKISGIKPAVRGTDCNLSGLENAAYKIIDCSENGGNAGHAARYVVEYIKLTLEEMLLNAMDSGKTTVLFVGGVMSNTIIKKYFTEKYNTSGTAKIYFTSPEYSSDNAVGAAFLARDADRDFVGN
jgi:N6-L-threonylcarbamoyladenine synthase